MSVFENAAAITVGGKSVAKITVDGATVWSKTSEYTNLLPLATDTDRTTIYDGDGYKTDTRLSSSGSTSTSTGTGMCASGFIPASPGDVLRVQGFDAISGTNFYVIAYNSANTKTGYKNISSLSGCTTATWASPGSFTLTLDEATFGSNFNAIRFCVRNLTADSIVTINEMIA